MNGYKLISLASGTIASANTGSVNGGDVYSYVASNTPAKTFIQATGDITAEASYATSNLILTTTGNVQQMQIGNVSTNH